MRLSQRLGILVVCAIASSAGTAAARECADAKQHLVIARRALQVHDYPRAIAEYEASYEADGEPVTLIFLARTYAQTGQLTMAIDLYRAYLDEVPQGQRTDDVESEIARLASLELNRRIAIFDDSDDAAFRTLPIVDDGR